MYILSHDTFCFGSKSAMSNDSQPVTVWACGNNDSWSHLKHGFNALTSPFAKLSDKAAQWVSNVFQHETRPICCPRLFRSRVTCY